MNINITLHIMQNYPSLKTKIPDTTLNISTRYQSNSTNYLSNYYICYTLIDLNTLPKDNAKI